MDTYIAIDIGGTHARIARIQAGSRGSFRIQKTRELLTKDYNNFREFITDVKASIREIWQDNIAGIGIGVGGLIDYKKGMVLDWTNCRWIEDHSFYKELGKEFGVPVSVRNDAECFAMGEWAFGAGKDHKSSVFFGAILGTGVGGCLLLDGRPFKGSRGYAGEIGEIEVAGNDLEMVAGGHVFKERFGSPGKELYQKALKGEAKALKAFDEYGRLAGGIVHSIVAAYDPDLIVLGGSVSKSFRFFSKSMDQHLKKVFVDDVWKGIKVKPSKLEDAGLPGALIPLIYDH
jgi:glucokinase